MSNNVVGDIAGHLDIHLPQGSDFQIPLTFEDGEGNYIDLTDVTAQLQIRPSAQSQHVILELTSDSGGIVIQDQSTDEGVGRACIDIEADVTKDLNFNRAVYHMEFKTPSDRVYRVLIGAVYLTKEVSR